MCAQLDSTCLFMLQLSCILNMVSVWKKATVRVFLCSDNLDAGENSRRKSRLDDLLIQLRIQALTCLVPIENVKNLLNRPVIPDGDLHHYQHSVTNMDILNTSEIYLRAANTLIKTYSDSSTLCFLYMPPPPPLQPLPSSASFLNLSINEPEINASSTSSPNNHKQFIDSALIPTAYDNNKENNKKYVKILEILSDSLPPCIYVNGVSCVTSTHL